MTTTTTTTTNKTYILFGDPPRLLERDRRNPTEDGGEDNVVMIVSREVQVRKTKQQNSKEESNLCPQTLTQHKKKGRGFLQHSIQGDDFLPKKKRGGENFSFHVSNL